MMEHEGTDPIVAHFSDPGRVAEYLVAPDAMNEARRDLVRRMVLSHVAAGSRVLEIGCGIGALTAELVTAGMLCTAVEFVSGNDTARQGLGRNKGHDRA